MKTAGPGCESESGCDTEFTGKGMYLCAHVYRSISVINCITIHTCGFMIRAVTSSFYALGSSAAGLVATEATGRAATIFVPPLIGGTPLTHP